MDLDGNQDGSCSVGGDAGVGFGDPEVVSLLKDLVSAAYWRLDAIAARSQQHLEVSSGHSSLSLAALPYGQIYLMKLHIAAVA